MPVNATYEYQLAEKEYQEANSISDKLKALQRMYATAPKHKSSEKLVKWIKEKIKKYKGLAAKEKKGKKGSSFLSIKKEGAARTSIIGITNSGKSTLLSKLTNAKPIISEIKFTTKLPEIGMLDYHGIKIQIVEIPAIVKEFNETKHGLFFMSIIRESDLIITAKDNNNINLIKKELKENDIHKKIIIYKNNLEKLKENIWNNLNLIKVYTKQPGKEKDHPPIAMPKGSNVKDLAIEVHKDFYKKFDYARLWGKSIKHPGSRVGLNHKLKDNDVVELHLK